MRPHVRWIPLLACVCMLSGGAVNVSSEQGKTKNPPAKEAKDRKDDTTKAKKPRVGEARPGRNDDDPRLVRWDVNGDGVLSRAEWKASPQLFDRLDVNRDDTLTRAELAERP
jgi:hypothetical protein